MIFVFLRTYRQPALRRPTVDLEDKGKAWNHKLTFNRSVADITVVERRFAPIRGAAPMSRSITGMGCSRKQPCSSTHMERCHLQVEPLLNRRP